MAIFSRSIKAAFLGAVLLLTACGGDTPDTPKPDAPSETTSPSASPSASSTPSISQPPIDEEDAELEALKPKLLSGKVAKVELSVVDVPTFRDTSKPADLKVEPEECRSQIDRPGLKSVMATGRIENDPGSFLVQLAKRSGLVEKSLAEQKQCPKIDFEYNDGKFKYTATNDYEGEISLAGGGKAHAFLIGTAFSSDGKTTTEVSYVVMGEVDGVYVAVNHSTSKNLLRRHLVKQLFVEQVNKLKG